MATDPLRVAAFCIYLAAWLVLAAAAIAGAIPRRREQSANPGGFTIPVLAGTLLQCIAALPITLSMKDGPLRPRALESMGAILLASLAAALYCWALVSARGSSGAKTLVTAGAYRWVRHPIYLAFFAMLLATGLLVSAGLHMVPAIILFVAGSELRIAAEEAELNDRFAGEYARYRARTRWRYLPGIR